VAQTPRASTARQPAGFSLRTRLNTHEMEAIAGRRLRLRAFVLHLQWPGGGIVWQTPVDLQVFQKDANSPTIAQHLWTLDWTRIALLGIGLLTALVLSGQKRQRT
jgi:hypothetical protein